MLKVPIFQCIEHGPRLIKQGQKRKLWKAEVWFEFSALKAATSSSCFHTKIRHTNIITKTDIK
jgi:hypothetical protein